MLAEEHDFEVESMEKDCGMFITTYNMFFEQLPYLFYSRGFINTARAFKIVLYPIMFVIGFIAYFLDKLDKNKDLPTQYECIFVKK